MSTQPIPAFRAPRVPVSVVIPCYRCADTIGRAIKSIAMQTQLPEAVILIDDLSGDGTLEQLHLLQSQYLPGWIQVIAKPQNDGPGAARNAGWDAAKTTYIAFLDADDSWHPRKIELQYRLMADNPQLALTGHRGSQLETPGQPSDDLALPAQHDGYAHAVGKSRLLLFNEFITRSVMLRRNLPQRFEPKKKYCEDYLLWMQIVFAGHAASVLEVPLAFAYKADFGEGGLSQQVWRMEQGELDSYRRIFREQHIGVFTAVPIYLFSLAKFARRYLRSRLSRWKKNPAGPQQPVRS